MNEMEKICLHSSKEQTKVSKTETTLILSGYSRELVNNEKIILNLKVTLKISTKNPYYMVW